MHRVGIFDFNRYICINLRRACAERVSGGFYFFESVYWRFVLDVSKSGKFQLQSKTKQR